jgi:peptidoglycan/xylan/chitin deacetylase (PgdA/CDA1 family)
MMLISSRPLTVLDYYRVPYQIGSDQAALVNSSERAVLGSLVSADGSSAALHWPVLSEDSLASKQALRPRLIRLGSLTLAARVVSTDVLLGHLGAAGRGSRWRAAEPVTDAQGQPLSALCRDERGGIALPFDPNEAVQAFWSEGYRSEDAGGVRLRSLALHAYYRMRPLLPRRLQIALRRAYSPIQARSRFPAWPLEESLHDFYDNVLGWVAEVARVPVPWIGPWPNGHAWALVLTHDVETAEGLSLMPVLAEVEERRGYVSSWNFVPKRYEVPESVLTELANRGCEVGIHGLYHDGRDLESARMLQERLPEMVRYAQKWRAGGFRSPATQRSWDLIAALPFDYDSSYPDTDPFEPQGGGCCSWWPFMNGQVVELPITLAQDHTVFVILRRRDGGVWMDKAEALRRRGGMALMITHPDYVRLGPISEAYDALLARYSDDQTAWRALPSEVSSWWRRRAESRLRSTSGGWEVDGPAAGEATIRFTEKPQEAASSWSTTSR